MAINKNHEFEELDGIKCAIVEKSISHERAMFLKNLLVDNGLTVVIVPSPPPKAAPAKAAATADEGEGIIPQTPLPQTFTMGVTDLTFNSTNAIFGRLLKTSNGHIVTQAYWNQQDTISHDDVPYYEHTKLEN